ncbi:MAG: CPXCG motif-containing cysteine-rich protein [Bdellovibrionota bacterium]
MKKKSKKKRRKSRNPPSGEASIQCPYCWQSFTIAVDSTGGETQSFVWDCEVCCRPIDVQLHFEPSSDSEAEDPAFSVSVERTQ